MEATKTIYKLDLEGIVALVKQRSARAAELNNESNALINKFKKEIKDNGKVLLISVPFNEILVTFGQQQMDNFFRNCTYPPEGLFLREINFFHIENANTHNLQYYTEVCAHLIYSDEKFNGSIAVEDLCFDDEYRRVSEQVVGLGHNPRFTTKEKYEEVRDVIREVRTKILEAMKK